LDTDKIGILPHIAKASFAAKGGSPCPMQLVLRVIDHDEAIVLFVAYTKEHVKPIWSTVILSPDFWIPYVTRRIFWIVLR